MLIQHVQDQSTNMATSSYLLSSSTPVHFKSSLVLICLLRSVLIFTVSQTAGVTHWKLQDNAITPAATDLSGPTAQQDDVFAMSLPTTDPEFAVLLRHATKVPSGSSAMGNRGTLRSGSSRACPVVSVSLDSGAVPGDRQSCSSSSGAGKSSGFPSEMMGSCGRQCSCRSNDGGTDGSCGRSVGAGGGGAVGGDSGNTGKQPRNPDGSGPM